MPQTNTETKSKKETEAETKVLPAVSVAVEAYAKADAALQSKLWPLVDVALKLKASNLNEEQIIGQFRSAFADYHKVKVKEFNKNIEYQRF